MKRILSILEEHYNGPVDMEFTVELTDFIKKQPNPRISILQCRPQAHAFESDARLPDKIPKERIVFSTSLLVPHGRVKDIRYVIFVAPESYYALPTPAERSELGRAIGRLNEILADQTFICVGPGRWGTTNPDLGVNIGYADIYNTSSLVEITGEGIGSVPDASFGTHFFQDLVEANIYPLAVFLDDESASFSREFFYNATNSLEKIAPHESGLKKCLRLIDVASNHPGYHLELIMDEQEGRAVAFLQPDHRLSEDSIPIDKS
jgi:hypothetical protein